VEEGRAAAVKEGEAVVQAEVVLAEVVLAGAGVVQVVAVQAGVVMAVGEEMAAVQGGVGRMGGGEVRLVAVAAAIMVAVGEEVARVAECRVVEQVAKGSRVRRSPGQLRRLLLSI